MPPAMKLIVHVDGGARGNPGPAAAACVISSPTGELLGEHAELLGTATNNVAEYRALLLGLARARELGASEVEVIGDSELIAKQVQGLYKVKHQAMRPLYLEAMEALARLRALVDPHRPARAERRRRRARQRRARPGRRCLALTAGAQCSGCADCAIASICALESSSSSVLVTQYRTLPGAPADHVDVRAVVDEPVVAPVDRLRAGVGEQRRVQPVGALEVVVAAERVLLPDDDVGVVQVPCWSVSVYARTCCCSAGAGLQGRVEHAEGHAAGRP